MAISPLLLVVYSNLCSKRTTIEGMYHNNNVPLVIPPNMSNRVDRKHIFVPMKAAQQQQGGNLFFHSRAILGILIPVRSISALKFARKLLFFLFLKFSETVVIFQQSTNYAIRAHCIRFVSSGTLFNDATLKQHSGKLLSPSLNRPRLLFFCVQAMLLQVFLRVATNTIS